MALRSLGNAGTSQSLVIWILRMASTPDAIDWVSKFEQRVLYNEATSKENLEVISAERLNALSLESSQAARVKKMKRRSGENQVVTIVSGNVGATVFQVRCFGPGDCWSWEDVLSVTSLQTQKIVESIPSSEERGK